MTLMESLSPRALAAPQSGIVELVNYARGRPGLIPLWAGEGDLPSPAFINQATKDSLDAGETFYTWQRGLPELRDALSRYYQRHFGVSCRASISSPPAPECMRSRSRSRH